MDQSRYKATPCNKKQTASKSGTKKNDSKQNEQKSNKTKEIPAVSKSQKDVDKKQKDPSSTASKKDDKTSKDSTSKKGPSAVKNSGKDSDKKELGQAKKNGDKGEVSKGTGKKHVPRNVKDIDAYDDIENFLGKGKQTDINPFTGKKDMDRIFIKQPDGTVRAVRMGDHEMRNPNNFHYHLEQWDKNGNFIRPDQSVKVNNTKRRR